jgi:hypothetical protein
MDVQGVQLDEAHWRRGKVGCKPKPRLVAPKNLFYARVWLLVSLYNFVVPHTSLRQGHTLRPPAMAIGLTDHVWSYREYIWLPVPPDPDLRQQMEERIAHLLTPALQEPARGHTRVKSPPTETKEAKSDAVPKAA